MYLALVLIVAGAASATRTVHVCGITFDIPRNWTVHGGEDGVDEERCGVSLKPPNWDSVRSADEREIPEWAIRVAVRRGDLKQACEWGILCGEPGNWYFGPVPTPGEVYPSDGAEEVKTPCCRAFRGWQRGQSVTIKGLGSVVATLDNPHAVILGPGRLAIVTEDEACEVGSVEDGEQHEPVIFDALVASLRFL